MNCARPSGTYTCAVVGRVSWLEGNVWLVYWADRAMDAVESGGKTGTDRHAVQLRGKPIWLGISIVVLVVATVLAVITLNSRAWLGGGVVLVFTPLG